MENKFKIIIPVVVILAFFGTLLIIFSSIYSGQRSNLVESYSVTNASNGDVYVPVTNAGARLKNNTALVVRTTPDNSFKCTTFNWGHSFAVNNGSNGVKKLNFTNTADISTQGVGSFDVMCAPNGTVKLFLAGNASNGSTKEGRGKHYNLSFTAARWTAAFNVSNSQQSALYGGSQQSTTYYTLLILAVILAVVMGFLGLKFGAGWFSGSGGFGDSGGGGGKIDLSGLFDKFER